MPINHNTEIGSESDAMSLWVNGKRIGDPENKAQKYTRYQFTRSILQQPSTFSFTVGSGDLAREILQNFGPRDFVQLRVGTTPIFTGMLEDPTFDGSSGATEVTLQGRDMIAPLTKSHVIDERTFGSPTYFELTKEVMKLCGYGLGDSADIDAVTGLLQDGKLPPIKLVGGNEANRKAVTRTNASARGFKNLVEEIETGLVSRTGGKIKYEVVHGQIGQTWFDFLVSQYKKIGLYLWCAGNGDFILTRPTANMEPIYKIERKRGQTRVENAAFNPKWTNRTSGRHSMVRCYGKGRPDKKGQIAIYGDALDFEMYEMGFRDVLTLHDSDCKTYQDCQHRAKRHLADERRANRTLVYPVSGHTTPSLIEPGKMAIWAPDTVARVKEDEISWWGQEIKKKGSRFTERYNSRGNYIGGDWTYIKVAGGIDEDMYIEKVEFIRDENGTRSNLHLMVKDDLYYLGEDTELHNESEQYRNEVTANIVGAT